MRSLPFALLASIVFASTVSAQQVDRRLELDIPEPALLPASTAVAAMRIDGRLYVAWATTSTTDEKSLAPMIVGRFSESSSSPIQLTGTDARPTGSIALSSSGARAMIAWFDERLENAKIGVCRGTGVLLRTADGWKIAQYNLSVPVPNELMSEVVLLIQKRADRK